MAIRNILDYGAVGDDSTDCTAAIQAALDACSAGDRVFVPHGTFRVSKPIRLNKSQVTLAGDGRWGSILKNQAAFCGCVLAMGPTEAAMPTTTALGNGAALDMSQLVVGLPGDSGNAYINMREAHTMELNGSASVCWELHVRTPAAWPESPLWVLGSQGLRFASQGPHVSYQLVSAVPGGLAFSVDIGGTTRQVSTGALSTSTYYHIAVDFDGSTLRMFVNGSMTGSAAAAGAIVQKSYETAYLGACSMRWPYSNARTLDQLACVVDSVRVSSSRYTSGFTPPAQGKLALDASTKYLCNFDETHLGFTKAYVSGGGAVWHLPIRPVQEAQELTFPEVRDIQIQASYAGAIHAYRCQQGAVRDIAVTTGRYGVLFRDNCYLADASSIYYVASQNGAWWGMVNGWACGPNKLTDLNFSGSAYGLINSGTCSLDTYYTSGISAISLLLISETPLHATQAIGAAISDEANAAAMECAVGLDGPGQVVAIGCAFEQSQYDTPLIVADGRRADVFLGCSMVAKPGGSAPLVKWLSAQPSGPKIGLRAASYFNTSGHALSDSSAAVRDESADGEWLSVLRDSNT